METSPSWESMYQDEKYSWFWPPSYDPEASPDELEAVVAHMQAPPGSRWLDLACGQGWLTIPLARRGYQVTGFDLSVALLSRAESAARAQSVTVEWVCGDMCSLPGEWTDSFESVSLALSEFGCFQDEPDNQKVLDEVGRVLKAEGRFLLDLVANRDGLVQGGGTHEWLEGDGFLVVEAGSLDLVSGIHTRVYHWYYQGQRYEAKWQIHAYTPPEVARMLEKAGFKVLAVYSNLKGDRLARDSRGMTFVAQKKARE
jgi:ubiquinone/menaquinone biosynthesis C-methylase UbiE